MELILFKYTCAKCANIFKSLEIPGEHYGEFLLRSNNGDRAYLMALDSNTFNNLDELLKRNIKLSNFDDYNRAAVLQNIFGITCDLAPDGSQYQIGRFPNCPKCKSTEMASWSPTNPPEFINEEIKAVSHEFWNKLTEEEKMDLVNNAVDSYLTKK